MVGLDDLPIEAPDSRLEGVLAAAVSVFSRYGFRKASMDEVARAAGVSRQGLYLQFADKEELFRRAVAYRLNQQLGAAIAALSRNDQSLQDNLIRACEEWAGRHVGMAGADAADLMCESSSLAAATLEHYHALFERALEHAVAASPLCAHCASGGFSAADAARALHAAASGLKRSSKSREEFIRGMSVVVSMFCMPLKDSKARSKEFSSCR